MRLVNDQFLGTALCAIESRSEGCRMSKRYDNGSKGERSEDVGEHFGSGRYVGEELLLVTFPSIYPSPEPAPNSVTSMKPQFCDKNMVHKSSGSLIKTIMATSAVQIFFYS